MLEVSLSEAKNHSVRNHALTIQTRFQKDVHLRKPYSYGPYNKVRGKEQRIRITEGCPKELYEWLHQYDKRKKGEHE